MEVGGEKGDLGVSYDQQLRAWHLGREPSAGLERGGVLSCAVASELSLPSTSNTVLKVTFLMAHHTLENCLVRL